jgi:predicted methyltransferase
MNRVATVLRWLLLLASIAAISPLAAQTTEALLDQALAGEHRSAANRARDKYRHPRETLLFFGLKPEMAVLEIWPAGGWYSEILAPVLRDKGKLYLAHSAIEDPQAAGLAARTAGKSRRGLRATPAALRRAGIYIARSAGLSGDCAGGQLWIWF